MCSTLYGYRFTMPKSKRDKKISLTKVDKKVGLETKQKLIENVRNAVDTYSRFVFSFQLLPSTLQRDEFSL